MEPSQEDAPPTDAPAFSAERELPPGTRVGRYLLLEQIGRGGMGVVYRAVDEHLGRKLAIKLIRPDRIEHAPQTASRLLREAQAMARLAHPNVVSIFDVGVYEDRVFFAMEYIEGATLRDWLSTPRPWRERLAMLLQAGEGLAAAHAAAVIHRDFKPDNVLVGADGRARVTDFGLARDDDEEAALHPSIRPDSPPPPLSDPPPAAHEPSARERDELAQALAEETGIVAPPAQPPRVRSERPSAKRVSEAPPSLSFHPTFAPATGLGLAPKSTSAIVRPGDPGSGDLLGAFLTEEGTVLGTIGYMAPEQARSRPTSALSDQFSFCVTVYVALYGEAPFPGNTLAQYVRSIARGPKAEAPGGEIPRWVRKVLLRGMSRSPSERFRSMNELLRALQNDPRRAVGRWVLSTLAATLLVDVTLSAQRAYAAHQQICSAPTDAWARVWDSDVRKSASEAFVAANPETGRERFDHVAGAIDAYVAQWEGMRKESCTATKLAHQQPEEVYTLRSECLSRRKTQLGAVTRLMQEADDELVHRAYSVAFGLDRIAWCGDVEALRSSGGLPDDPEKRAKVLAVRTKLADADALYLVGKPDPALSLVHRAVNDARAAAHAQTTAEALLAEGELLSRRDESEEPQGPLRESFFAAIGAAADAIAVRAAAHLAYVLGESPNSKREAETWLAYGRASVARLGGNDDLDLLLLRAEGNILAAARQSERALTLDENVVERTRKLYGVHRNTAVSLYNLWADYLETGNAARARPVLEEASRIDESIGGPLSPDLGRDLVGLGWTLIELGELALGEAQVHRGIDILEHNSMGPREAEGFLVLTWSALARGDVDGALTNSESASSHIANTKTFNAISSGADVVRGLALVRAGRPSEALALCAKGLAAQDAAHEVVPGKPYDWDALLCEGEALIALGRPRESIPPLERSLTLHNRVFPAEYARDEFALARALSAAHGDPLRAAKLAADALDEFARFPFLSFEVTEVKAWLARATPSRQKR